MSRGDGAVRRVAPFGEQRQDFLPRSLVERVDRFGCGEKAFGRDAFRHDDFVAVIRKLAAFGDDQRAKCKTDNAFDDGRHRAGLNRRDDICAEGGVERAEINVCNQLRIDRHIVVEALVQAACNI